MCITIKIFLLILPLGSLYLSNKFYQNKTANDNKQNNVNKGDTNILTFNVEIILLLLRNDKVKVVNLNTI